MDGENVQQTLADGKEKPSKSLYTLHSCCKETVNCFRGMGDKKVIFNKTMSGCREVRRAVGENELLMGS